MSSSVSFAAEGDFELRDTDGKVCEVMLGCYCIVLYVVLVMQVRPTWLFSMSYKILLRVVVRSPYVSPLIQPGHLLSCDEHEALLGRKPVYGEGVGV